MESGETGGELVPQLRVEVRESVPELVVAPAEDGFNGTAAFIGQGKQDEAAVFGRSGTPDVPSCAQPVGQPGHRRSGDFKDVREGAAGQCPVVVKGEQHAHLRHGKVRDLVHTAHGDGEQVARGPLEGIDVEIRKIWHTTTIA